MKCKQHPQGTLHLVEGGRAYGYEDEYERVPCLCPQGIDRTASEPEKGRALPKPRCLCGKGNVIKDPPAGLYCFNLTGYRHAEARIAEFWCSTQRCIVAWCVACFKKEFSK